MATRRGCGCGRISLERLDTVARGRSRRYRAGTETAMRPCDDHPDQDSAGHAITGDPWGAVDHWDRLGRWRDQDVALRARIIAFMAGAAAEVEFFGKCAGGDGEDRYQIDLMLDSLLPAGADSMMYEARLRRFTRSLVRRHRDKIERVADALLAFEHLSAEQIDAIVSSAPARVEA